MTTIQIIERNLAAADSQYGCRIPATDDHCADAAGKERERRKPRGSQ